MEMHVMFFCSYLGRQHLGIEAFVRQVKETGYAGVEIPLAPEAFARDR